MIDGSVEGSQDYDRVKLMIKSASKLNTWMTLGLLCGSFCFYATLRYQLLIHDNSILPIWRSTPGGFAREVTFLAVLTSLNLLSLVFLVWSIIKKRHIGYALLFTTGQVFSTFVLATILDSSIPIF